MKNISRNMTDDDNNTHCPATCPRVVRLQQRNLDFILILVLLLIFMLMVIMMILLVLLMMILIIMMVDGDAADDDIDYDDDVDDVDDLPRYLILICQLASHNSKWPFLLLTSLTKCITQ